jgi:hypothetical protein
LNFDCHVDHTKIDSEREYFLVVRARNGMRKQRGFYGRDLLRLTTIDVTLDLGFPGNPPLPGGPVSRSLKDQSLQVWMEQLSRIPGGDRERVSNILSVR